MRFALGITIHEFRPMQELHMHLTDEVNFNKIIGPSACAEEANKLCHDNLTRSGSVKGYNVSNIMKH
jgi:hypothetical protein